MAVALMAPAAMAQDTTPTTPPAASAEAQVAPAQPPAVTTKTTVETRTAAPAAAEDPTSDHEKVVGHIGVGYFGLTNIPIASGAAAGAPARADVKAPVIGVRYWLSEKLGLDLGLGFGVASSSQEIAPPNAPAQSIDRPGVFAMAFHGGVPLVFAHQKHYKFLLVPELNVGFATSTESPAPGAPVGTGDISRTGFHLDIGARIGSEIHFGFIGVPQLSLQASVGLLARRDAWKVKQDVGNQTASASVGETTFGTTVQGEPWALFVNNISAIYYLP